MNRPLRALIGLAAGAVLLSTSALAIAQDRPAAPPMAEKWKEHQHERSEARARALHDVLNLRPDQDAAFKAFLASITPPHMGEGPMPGEEHEGTERLTTPQRLDRMAARMAEHQAEFQRHADAVKRFYAILSPEQQRAFDALPALGGLHPPGGPEGHGGPEGRDSHEGPPPPPPGA